MTTNNSDQTEMLSTIKEVEEKVESEQDNMRIQKMRISVKGLMKMEIGLK